MAKITQCQFIVSIGSLNNVPLFGTQYPLIFPAVLVVLVLFNLFNLYGRLMGCLGLKNTFTYSSGDQAGIDHGKSVYNQVCRSSTQGGELLTSQPSRFI